MSFLSLCSLTSASEIPLRDSFPVTAFSREELIKGEPIGWKTHKGLCREIEKRARIITIENGNENAGKWLNYTVNHYQDYVQDFGQKPPKIVYIGIQTNAERNYGKVESWYSDIALYKSQ